MTDTPNPTTLDELLSGMLSGEIPEDDWASLPNFGGEEPADTSNVWSWDETRVIAGSGDDLCIYDRDDEIAWWN